MKSLITGLIPAVFTPMHSDGSLNLELVPRITEYLLANKIGALYVCGATGEGPSLTAIERKAVAEAYVQAAAGRIPVIVQVGHNSLFQARRLAEHAAAIGAEAISAVPPHFFKMHSIEALVDSLALISAGAPDLPLYYYHIPRLTAVEIDLLGLLRLASQRLPLLEGVKYSNFKIYELQACAEFEDGRYSMLFGSDEMLLSGLAGGAKGAVGTTYNFAAPLYLRIMEAFLDGDIRSAQKYQSLSVKMVNTLNRYATAATNLPPMKTMMQFIGLDCGPLRLPLPTLNGQQVTALRSDMEAIGFFAWDSSEKKPRITQNNCFGMAKALS